MGYSPPGSSVHGIFQARVLEWVAISFSNHLLRGFLFLVCCLQLTFYHWQRRTFPTEGKALGALNPSCWAQGLWPGSLGAGAMVEKRECMARGWPLCWDCLQLVGKLVPFLPPTPNWLALLVALLSLRPLALVFDQTGCIPPWPYGAM